MPSVSQVSLWQTSHRHRRAGKDTITWSVKCINQSWQYLPLLWSRLSTNTQRVRTKTRIEVCITGIDLKWGLVDIVDIFLFQLTQWKGRGLNMIPKRWTATMVDHLDGQMWSTVFKKYQERSWELIGRSDGFERKRERKESRRIKKCWSRVSLQRNLPVWLSSILCFPSLPPSISSILPFLHFLPPFPSAFCAQFQTSRGTHCLRQDSQWGSFKTILPPLLPPFALRSKNGFKALSFEFLVTWNQRKYQRNVWGHLNCPDWRLWHVCTFRVR